MAGDCHSGWSTFLQRNHDAVGETEEEGEKADDTCTQRSMRAPSSEGRLMRVHGLLAMAIVDVRETGTVIGEGASQGCTAGHHCIQTTPSASAEGTDDEAVESREEDDGHLERVCECNDLPRSSLLDCPHPVHPRP